MCKKKEWVNKKLHPNVLEGKDLIREISDAVVDGKLNEPFYPRDIKKAVPGWNDTTYKLFPWKHCLQNPNRETTALFFYCGLSVPKPRNPPYKDRYYRLLREDDL